MTKLLLPLTLAFVALLIACENGDGGKVTPTVGVTPTVTASPQPDGETPTPRETPAETPTPQAELKFDSPAVTSDPFNDPSGPFYHQILKASSPDGVNFMKEEGVVFDKASVPDAIRLPSGRLVVYAVDGARRSNSGIMVAISDDDGQTWQQGSVQLESPMNFGGADPEVVLLPDDKLRIYYVVFPMIGQPGMIDPEIKNKVFSAVSSDGINFQEEDGVRFEHAQITDPDVVKIGDKWFMYLAQGPRLIAATSPDGLSFQLEATIREQGSVSNTVPIGDNLWRQFFCDRGIRSAISSDGLAWQDDSGFRLQPESDRIMCDPVPVQVGPNWLLFYKVGPGIAP